MFVGFIDRGTKMNVPQILMIIWLSLRVLFTIQISVDKNEGWNYEQIARDFFRILFQVGIVLALCLWGGFWK